ncbi:MAG: hypothetical protein JO337_09925 [Acidimicrobiales bacterium]|nr:hypothetical protein [Acidimicrobiales bacterium]
MTDEELLNQLRRTLRERATGLRPGPGRLPWPELTGPELAGTELAGPELPVTRRRLLRRASRPTISSDSRSGPDGEAYDRDPTGRMRALQVGQRRPLVVAGAVVAVAAGIAAAVGLAVSGPGHSKVTYANQSPAPAPTGPAATSPTPAPAASTTTAPPPIPTVPVPTGFQPLSVTFVSARTGWAFGQYPCGSGLCPTMAVTTDGGVTWSARPAPTVPTDQSTDGSTSAAVRFADALDGWVTTPTRLWSTHDGGYHWASVPSPAGANGRIVDLEAAGATAYLVTLSTTSPTESVYSTPATSDHWSASSVHPQVGAGPVPRAQLVLFGPNGWLVDVDRTTTGGAHLVPGAGWQDWMPPCATANGPGLLAAASPTDLAAICEEGTWGTPDPGTEPNQQWLFRSSDGGASFQAVGALPGSPSSGSPSTGSPSTGSAGEVYSATVAPGMPLTVVVATNNGLVATFDGGLTWGSVYPSPSSGPNVGADFVGFTTSSQGLAILGNGTGTTMLMTRDGGHTWSKVSF